MKKINRKNILSDIKRIVVKVGTSTLTHPDMRLNIEYIDKLVSELVQAGEGDRDVMLVTSGAIAAGMGKLGWETRPKAIPRQQAAAAVGQSHIMHTYEESFNKHSQPVAQILLTQADINDRRRYTNASNTLSTLLQCSVIPIINENDTVAVDEIKVGENDTLAALVTNLVKADLLIILSDIDGFYDNTGKVISVIPNITPELREMAGGEGSAVSSGGMITKLNAAEIVTGSGEVMVIANGKRPNIITQILEGHDIGTIFLPKSDKMSGRKRWIAYSLSCRGTIKVDAGAKLALVERGRSLLPSGVIKVSGDFEFGDSVRCIDENDREFARGLANYSAKEIDIIGGKRTDQIEPLLGYMHYTEVIHRDNLVILDD